ncbi:MAG: metallophosphoesterase [Candidatus Pacearchaeota archaeon]|nr:metallophosphoesterase [Candidatus Pacearchaeota archaeon]
MNVNFKYIGKVLLIEDGEERILVIGDLHLGYEGSLRSSGLMIPLDLYKLVMGDFEEIFKYLGSENVKLDKIVLLGDLKHEFGSILKEEWDYIGRVLIYLRKKCGELIVIEGNHDKILQPILKNVNAVGNDYFIWGEIAFMHGDKSFKELEKKEIKCWVMGHGHPAVTITDGTKKEKYKCFLEGEYKLKRGVKKRVIVVPSFFPLIEGTDARDFDLGFAWNFSLKNFNVRIVGDNLEVFEFGKLGKI